MHFWAASSLTKQCCCTSTVVLIHDSIVQIRLRNGIFKIVKYSCWTGKPTKVKSIFVGDRLSVGGQQKWNQICFCFCWALPYMGQKQKQKWIITPQFTHFCGFHHPYANKNKNNSDFIFVGPRLITYLQQKWISFLFAFLVNKNENNFEDSMTYPSFLYCFMYSTKVLVWQHRLVNDDTVHQRILCSNSCLTVSGFTLSFLRLSFYVYALQLQWFVVRFVVAHHGKRCYLRCNRDNSLSWQ